MTGTLRLIVERELKKLNELSDRDPGTLSSDHLEALEVLARIMAKDSGDEPMAMSTGTDADLIAAIGALPEPPES